MMGGRYFTLLIILAINLYTILELGFRINYISQLLIFIVFLLVSLIILTLTYKEKSFGLLTSLFFIASLVNLFYLKNAFSADLLINLGTRGMFLFGINLFLNGVGFVIGTASIKSRLTEEEKNEIIEEVIEPRIKEIEEKLEQGLEEPPLPPVKTYGASKTIKKTTKRVKKTYNPGKFVASKEGKVYHALKCDWAKKIKKKNQVWFKNKKQASNKGYKQHSCLTK
jgi:hypothetical protein